MRADSTLQGNELRRWKVPDDCAHLVMIAHAY
jgi:hypothetical protein